MVVSFYERVIFGFIKPSEKIILSVSGIVSDKI